MPAGRWSSCSPPRTSTSASTAAPKGAGDELYARKLDKAYDRGTVKLVLALEHLGAYQWDAVPRGGGCPA